MPTRALLAGLILTVPMISGAAAFELPSNGPIPLARPYAPVDNEATTASIARHAPDIIETAADPGDMRLLKKGLDALSAGNTASARKIRDSLPARSLDRHIMAWAIALSGGEAVPSSEIAQAARDLQGWPGMATLRSNSEKALYRENPPARTVVAAFGSTAPQTYEGAVILARAYVALSNRDAARAVLSPFWRNEKLEAKQEVAILREFGGIISAADHRYRMQRMLYEDRIRSAERVAGLAGGEALTKAWAAVIRKESNAGKLLDAVPQSQRLAGYYFAKARYLRRAEKFAAAAKAMLEAPSEPDKTIDPDAWWAERRVLSRELLDTGDVKSAYRVAAAHKGGRPATIADAEFHAGWYALRGLSDPNTAARHFARIAEIADGPISLSRAYYWLGRAAEAGGPGNSRSYYERAANYGTAFYGQVAAAKLGRNIIAAAYPDPTPIDRQAFNSREAVRAIRRLEEAGYASRADVLYRDLAQELTSAGELAMLAVMAEKRGNHYLALRVGKIAASRGLNIGALAHPVGVIPSSADISGSGKALAYAIARQESEFNVAAVSGAGARGLLQLLPGTAKDMARVVGLPYSQSRLTNDAAYNAALGAAYLGEQLGRFDGSYILTFAGYNAGPRRAREWIERYGDPRGKDINTVIDWIERIPFTETRNYVQRVMENYQVYKMRLQGRFDIISDLVNGRRG
ncbi:soluble lytic murein transglycosylase [Mesorhizobium sp. J18]|uniref:lytic transglycosylase domain-containing protein n=1 Tax=Mesorhizobium sp. J18 TaxID=935263 RepID=UPI00119BCD1C|nr:lytic transglycosylase domain-containing protein [Mesorhizobium sp. J18]TWG94697.1 soluble lytic murein transglycosylase [Mesorhizobium sp. J18]